MAPTLDVGGGSGLVAVNRGLRTCTSGGLSWAWWVRSWAVVNIVLAGFVTFGSFGLLDYDVLVVSSGVVGGFMVVVFWVDLGFLGLDWLLLLLLLCCNCEQGS